MKKTDIFNENGNLNYKNIPLLAFLSEEEFLSMKSNFEVLYFKKGDPIFKSGDPASKMFIIYEGFMKIAMNLSDGREQILYIYQKGDFVGGLNLLSGDKYVYNGTALKNTVVVTISNDDFHNVLLKNSKFVMKVLEKSYERIRRSEELIDRLCVINADLKVAKVLMNLVKVYGQKTDEGILLKLTLNQEELGSFTGITRETMSRKLNQFEDLGLIKIVARGKILITDVKGLSKLIV
ncbi:MAG: Crp/Fnr family transcriptional regulator [Tissierellia bacterium]|nr:Crp/Fnr family transcriptional regulator [Tissierellia bacterium]